jgi:hypothetical protein
MKYYYVLFSSIFITFSSISIAQTSESKFVPAPNAGLKKSTKISQQPHSVSNPAIENKDGYMGKKDMILEKLISNQIPESFPKYTEGLPAEEYMQLVKMWRKTHPELLKEKYRKNSSSSINGDMYMGKKEAILKRLISNQIPASLPKYKSGQSSEDYMTQIRSWSKTHPELLKEKYRKN